jgi:hypothetical protein
MLARRQTMKKPDWADEAVAESFDYGGAVGYAAKVGPIRHAIRTHARRLKEKPVYGPYKEVTREEYCWECEQSHEVTRWEQEVIKPAVYEDVPMIPPEEVWEEMRAWFQEKAKEAVDFLAACERNGLI